MENYYKADKYQARKSVGYLIRSCSNMITTQMEEAFHGKNVSFIQFVILMQLRDGISSTAVELCTNVRYDSGALTRVLDQLEENKLLKRERSKQDRRVVELKLTAKGVKTAEDLLPIVVNKYNSWLEDFKPAEADQIIELLTKLKTKICSSAKVK